MNGGISGGAVSMAQWAEYQTDQAIAGNLPEDHTEVSGAGRKAGILTGHTVAAV